MMLAHEAHLSRSVIVSCYNEEDALPADLGTSGASATLLRHPALVAGLIVVLLAPALVWIFRDHHVWSQDTSWYGEVSVDLWYWHTRLRSWWWTMLHELYLKPPGIVWFGQCFVPLQRVFGSVERALLFSVVLTQAITLWLLDRIARVMFPAAPAVRFAGLVFAAGAQLFVSTSHQYLVEPLQTLSVTWVFLVAVCSPGWPRAKVLMHLVAALILGALAKSTTILYCVVPAAYVVFAFLRRRDALRFAAVMKSWSGRGLVLFSVVLGPLGAAWYLTNMHNVLQHFRNATGAVALDYGYQAPVAEKLVVWAGIARQEFLDPYGMWAGALVATGCAAALLLRRDFRRALATAPLIKIFFPLCALQIAIVIVTFASNVMVESRFLLALLPSIAVLAMSVVALTPWRPAVFAVAVLAVCQWATVQWAALGGPVLADRSPWLLVPVRDRANYDELTRAVQATSVVPGGYNIIGVEEPSLNANAASFFAAKNRLTTRVRSYYTSLGYAEKDVGSALKRIAALKPPYIITLDEGFQPMPPNFLNVVSLPVLRELKQDAQFSRVPFPSSHGIVIFQRRAWR